MLCPHAVFAQSFDAWYDARVAAVAALRSDAELVDRNGTGADRQREAPADSRSTSLVDQSSATDFVSAAVSLATVVDPKLKELASALGSGGTGGAQSVTASLYALLAGLNGRSPTDPRFYREHVNARRASFTIGTAVSDPDKDGTDRPAAVYGIKILLLNGRDIYTRRNQDRLVAVQNDLTKAGAAQAPLKQRLQLLMFAALDPEGMVSGKPDAKRFAAFLGLLPAFETTVLPRLTPVLLDRIDAEIGAVPELAVLRETIDDTYDAIQKEQQLALAMTSRVRPDSGFSEHRAELVFDYGLSPRVTWTANGSFDYVDKKALGTAKGGRFATEFVGDLTTPRGDWSRLPIRLSVGAQVQWSAGEQIQRDVQAKLTIPFAPGVDLPIVYRYTTMPQTDASGAQTRIGLSLDLSRITKAR